MTCFFGGNFFTATCNCRSARTFLQAVCGLLPVDAIQALVVSRLPQEAQSSQKAGDMAGDARIQARENSTVGFLGLRLLDSDNHGKSMGRLIARRAASLLLAGMVAAVVYQNTERKQQHLFF